MFYPDAKERGELLKQGCSQFGLRGLFPLDAELGPKADPRAIFDANIGLVRQARGVLANMTPFRGPSTDVGTAWEIGFAYGLGKPVIAYSSDTRVYRRKVEDCACDEGCLFVEDFDLIDNLMLPCSLSGYIKPTFESAAKYLRAVLDGVV